MDVGTLSGYCPRSALTPTITVRFWGDCMIRSAIRMSFQTNREFRMPIEMSAGLPTGIMIRAQTPKRPLPSTRAASVSSRGMPE